MKSTKRAVLGLVVLGVLALALNQRKEEAPSGASSPAVARPSDPTALLSEAQALRHRIDVLGREVGREKEKLDQGEEELLAQRRLLDEIGTLDRDYEDKRIDSEAYLGRREEIRKDYLAVER